MKILKYILISCLFTILLIGGFYIGFNRGNDLQNNNIEGPDKVNSNEKLVNNKNENNIIQYIIQRKDSDSISKQSQKISNEIVKMNERKLIDFIKQSHPDWIIKEIKRLENNDIVVHAFEEGTLQDDDDSDFIRYKIVAKNGELVIYKVHKNGEEIFYDNTYISVDTLKEEDYKMFEEGIIKDTIEEVRELLENYSS